jgi:hypothetical protein
MIETIPPIPSSFSFENIRIASLKRPLVPFIGAGVSMLAGCPGWDVFGDLALRFFLSNGVLSPADYDQIKSLPSRIKLSLALDLQESSGLKIDFRELLSPSADKKSIGERVYGRLGTLSTTFVTTNYDNFLDGGRDVFHEPHRLTIENLLVQNSVFHIHGSVLDPDNMVRTTDEYLRRYASHEPTQGASGENPFLTFLRKLFELRTVLFIGYSLSELEILEYVLQKSASVSSKREAEPRHFIIQGFFSHELPLARSLNGYFARFGVTLIPFSRDERDWDQLENVVDALASALPSGTPLSLPKLREMEGLLE